jgi:hypothetical protein
MISRSIFTDILEFRARVLVISGGTGGYGRAALSPDTALPVPVHGEFQMLRKLAILHVHAGGSLNPPIAGSLVGDIVVTEPGVAPRADADVVSQYTDITPGTLASYGTPIRAGRDIDDRDPDAAPKVMLVSEALVRRFFPGRDLVGAPLALTFRSGQSGDVPLGTYTVVGVTGDAAYRSIRTPMGPTIYVPMARAAARRSFSTTSTSRCARRAVHRRF